MAADDASISVAVEWLRQWSGPLFGGGGATAFFMAGRKTSAFEAAQKKDRDDIDKHDKRLEALETARAAADVKIAELPTRTDLAAGLARTEAQMQAGFSQITQLIARQRD